MRPSTSHLTFAFSLVLPLVAPRAPAGEPDLSPAGVARFEQRFHALKQAYDGARASYAKRIERSTDPEYTKKLERSLEGHHLAFLRFVVTLEKDLVLMATPKDAPDAETTPSGLTSSERRRVENLRQDIRDEERERIVDALKEGAALHGDEDVEEDIDRDEQSLDALFQRAASRLRRDIEKARRAIAREQESGRPDDAEVAELREEVAAAEAEISELHLFFYGYRDGAGFDHAPGWPADHPAEKLRTAMAAARDETIRVLRAEAGEGGEKNARGGVVGGSFVYSANLGVVLDISGSMTPFIEPLKNEIAETFEAPRYREAGNCRLPARGFTAADLSTAAQIRDTMTNIEELIVVYGVDTVYWFTDLQDDIEFAALRRLRYLLRRGGTAFHVKSVDRRPNRDIEALIDDFQQ